MKRFFATEDLTRWYGLVILTYWYSAHQQIGDLPERWRGERGIGQLHRDYNVGEYIPGCCDPVPYLNKYASRLPLIHLKNMDKTNGSFTEVGTGVIDLKGVLEVARTNIAEWVIYEQDSCRRPSLESARISINNIQVAIKA